MTTEDIAAAVTAWNAGIGDVPLAAERKHPMYVMCMGQLVCLFVCFYGCLLVCLFVYLFVCLFVNLLACS